MIRRNLPKPQLTFVILLTLTALFWSGKGLGQVTTQTFTSGNNATYTVPGGVTTIIVEVWGGGGGGGGSNSNNNGGSGGGGGGYSMAIFNVAGGQTATYTVGTGGAAGGAAGGNGVAGTFSNFIFDETTLRANGGGGGRGNAGAIGAGGTASGGTVNLDGNNGTTGGTRGGDGGSSPNGGAGGQGRQDNYGLLGGEPGGGGGGGERNNGILGIGASNYPGGAGARGQITITEIQTETTYYSYQSGNWNSANTWTTDPSGSLQQNPGIPTASSRVVILNGRTVTVTTNNALSAMLEIQDGAILDARAQTGLNFGLITGQGRMRASRADLPQGNYALFTQSGGGTIEIYGNASTTNLSLDIYNNLEINTTNAINLTGTTQINGNLLVSRGTLNISSPAGSSITVNGNITVNSGATLGMGSSPNTYERDLYVLGDFENYGTVTLTDRTSGYANPTRGVRLYFINGTKDQNFVVNGLTRLDRLIVDKGSDDTYMLDVNANNTGYFNLHGDNSQEATNQESPGDVINDKALELLAGTLRLGSNISIPRLLTQGSNANRLYTIDQDATLILDGADVAVTDQTNTSAIVIYGKLKIIGNSNFTATGRQGIILRAYGVLEIGGTATVNTTVVRTSSRLDLGTHRGTFKMTGGNLTISGNNLATSHASFALPFSDNTFQMSGGNITILNPSYYTGQTNYNESWLVSSAKDNISVTGGNVIIQGQNYNSGINSTAPFYNLTLTRGGSSNRTIQLFEITSNRTNTQDGETVITVPIANRRELIVLNNFTIDNGITFNPNNQNVTVGGNFTQTGTYTPGTNTTTFNGFSIQTFTNSGTITAGGLYDMVLDNSANLIVTNNLTVHNNLSINPQTTLRDGGRTISVAGQVLNSGTHQSETGGSLILNGAGNQTIEGDGYGRFGNLTLNKSGGNTIANAHLALDGNLRLVGNQAQLKIGKNRLWLGENSHIYSGLTGTSSARTDFNENRMVITEGNQSDYGIEKTWNSAGSFTYPFGVEGKYTPALVDIDAGAEPDAWGTLSLNPVNNPHPLTTNIDYVLQYYWNLRRTNMTGIPTGNLRLRFYYLQADVKGNESSYSAARYFAPEWEIYTGSDGVVTTLSNEILVRGNLQDPHGHFTAGEVSGFGDVTTYYSRETGNWNNIASWALDAGGTQPATNLPGKYSPVFIQNNHTITITDNNILVGSLNIDQDGVLDVGTTTGHFFGLVHESTVTGTGKLRISSNTATAEFPGGDFGEFLGENGGTVEYYTTGTQDYTMPRGNTQPIIILNESFESSVPPAGWSAININASNNWSRSATQSRTGSYSAYHPAGNSTNTTTSMLITPAINMSDLASYQLTFYRYNSYPSRYTYQGIWISTTNANNRNQFSELVELGQGNSSWQQHTIDLSDYVGEQTVYVAFVYRRRSVGGASDNVYIDDVSITKTKGGLDYHHLVVNPDNNRTITLPGIDVTTSGNTTITGNGTVQTSSETATALTVQDNLLVTTGATFRIENTRPFRLEQKGGMTIETGGAIGVNNTGANQEHRLNLYSNTVNNGNLAIRPDNNRRADIYFLGTANQTFSGTGTATLNRVYVNKGTSQTPLVNVTASSFGLNSSLSQALFIENGTIRFSGTDLDLALSSTEQFAIPATGCLSVNGSTITVGNANNDSGDLMLTGKVEVLDGILNIGSQTGNSNNDIEYATGGSPEIVIEGGTLNVYGQIRRSPLIATGNLNYHQSGGDVYLHGRNREIGRALLEILNDGQFIMSGGGLHLVQGATSATQAGNTFGELYLKPATHNVTGGTINIGTSATPAGNNHFNLYLGSPVYNITVNGETNAKTAYLRTFPANLKGSLTIDGPAASIFNAGVLDVNIGGDLINNSSSNNALAVLVGQILEMNGQVALQTIRSNGILRLRNLIINNSHPNGIVNIEGSSVTQTSDDLIVENGVFILNRFVSVLGNIVNNNIISSGNSNGYLNIAGTNNQQISGVDGALFGHIRINTPAELIAQISFSINGDLRFLKDGGNLNMGEHNLSLGENATITSAGENRFIITDGTIADGGVTKRYPASGGGNFTFPVGVAEKYTPATINVTNTGGAAGAITVKPVNKAHPSTTNELADELKYFWEVTSTGFGANPTVNHTYQYVESDVVGIEAQYVNARYIDYTWFSQTETMDYTNHRILFTGVNYIDGDYTAGINQEPNPNFGIIYKYYSRVSGNWFTAASWRLDSPTGPTATTAPKGNPVFIQSGHTITINSNGAFAGSVRIEENAKLEVGQTLQHDIGHLRGGGTIAVTSQGGGSYVFPGGEYTDFMSNPSSTVEYSGAGTLPTNLKTYQNVKFLGATTKNIPAIDLLVLGNLTIDAGVLNNQNNRTIRMEGNWINNAANGFTSGTGTVIFQGAKEQTLTSTGGETFYNLTIGKSNESLTLNSPATVNRFLRLNSGIVNTTSTNILTVNYATPGAIVGGNSSSYVNGPLRRNVNSGSNAAFPVGNDGRYGNIEIFQTNSSGSQFYTAQYYNQMPGNRDNLAAPLQLVSDNEYWTLTGTGNPSANVRLRWDANSNIIPNTALDRQKLRVARNVPPWTRVGQTVTDGGQTSGTVATSTRVNLGSTPSEFTLALEQTASAQITSGNVAGCNYDGFLFPVEFNVMGDAPLAVILQVNGVNFRAISGLSEGSHTANFTYTELFAVAGANDYEVTISSVTDRNGLSGIILGSGVTLTLYPTPAPIISGPTSVMTGSTTNFSVTPVTGDTYAWSVSALGTISGSSTGSTVAINWGAATGVATITLTQSNANCYTPVTYEVDVRDWPVITGDFDVCANSTETYATKQVDGHTYAWVVEGGTIQTGQDTYQITIQWSNQTAGRITLTQNGNTISQDVVINPSPTVSLSIANGGNICDGNGAVLTFGSTQAGGIPDYYLELDGNPVADYNNLPLPRPNPFTTAPFAWDAGGSNTHTFSVLVTNTTTGCQSTAITRDVTVYSTPQKPTVNTAGMCFGATENVNVEIPYSETGVNYEVFRVSDNQSLGGPLPGNGSTLQITVDITEPTTCYVLASNTHCQVQSDEFDIDYFQSPIISSLTIDPETICHGESAELKVEYEVFTASFLFSVLSIDADNAETPIFSGDENSVTATPYTVTINPTWDSSLDLPGTGYSYQVIITDGNGCIGKYEDTLPTITVWKVPQTGPPYHIPNTHTP